MVLCFEVLNRGEIPGLFNLDLEAHPQRTMGPLRTLISSPQPFLLLLRDG